PRHRVLEDSVPGEEAAHRSVDSRCRAQGKHREPGDAELASEPVQRRAVWSATRKHLPVADADVEVSLQDGTLPGDQLRAQGFQHDSERGRELCRDLSALEAAVGRLDDDAQLSLPARELDVQPAALA